MTEYKFDLPLRPGQLQAIGMVAVEWSYLESVIDAAIWNLAHVPNEAFGAAITTHLGVPARLDMLSTLYHLTLDDRLQWDKQFSNIEAKRQKEQLAAIRKGVEALARRRNAVLHARWVRGDSGSPLTFIVQARGVLKRTKRGMPEAEIQAVAQQIAEQTARLRAVFEIDAEDEA